MNVIRCRQRAVPLRCRNSDSIQPSLDWSQPLRRLGTTKSALGSTKSGVGGTKIKLGSAKLGLRSAK